MDLDELFGQIENREKKSQKVKQVQQIDKQQKSMKNKEQHQLKMKLNHEINRLELVKLTAENIYQQSMNNSTGDYFQNEKIDAQIIELVGDSDLYGNKIQNKNFLIGKFEKAFQLKNNADGEQEQPLKNGLNRQLKIFKRSLGSLTYEAVKKLNNLWKLYIEDLLSKETQVDSKFQRLLKADLHGALIQIVYSKCKTYEGQEGIVVREKKKSFIIIKENDQLSVIEKENTIFLLPINNKRYRLHGCHLMIKPSERIRKDLKYHSANTFCYQQM
ncbi:unnamed protein product [Paramecium sonneborni]|uniref:Uncharacterized protein n=1 Tax=Paramecium sonneborni TaxID=65129 RepID=A0A8S1QV35_9CILI|nr:unnamed protein product [Paramecium sonneborni]CAD8118766.1 unnamed protein product [Paramecium sonneborni]